MSYGRMPQIMYGAMLGYEYLKPSDIYVRAVIKMDVAQPILHPVYVLLKLFTEDPFRLWIDHEWMFESVMGYSFGSKSSSVVPYIGFGYFQDRQEDLHVHLHEKRTYVPIGLLLQQHLFNSLKIGIRAQANIMCTRNLKINGQKIHLSKKVGFLVEAPVTWDLYKHLDFSFIPVFNYIPRSTSPSIEWGALCGYGLRLELGCKW